MAVTVWRYSAGAAYSRRGRAIRLIIKQLNRWDSVRGCNQRNIAGISSWNSRFPVEIATGFLPGSECGFRRTLNGRQSCACATGWRDRPTLPPSAPGEGRIDNSFQPGTAVPLAARLVERKRPGFPRMGITRVRAWPFDPACRCDALPGLAAVGSRRFARWLERDCHRLRIFESCAASSIDGIANHATGDEVTPHAVPGG